MVFLGVPMSMLYVINAFLVFEIFLILFNFFITILPEPVLTGFEGIPELCLGIDPRKFQVLSFPEPVLTGFPRTGLKRFFHDLFEPVYVNAPEPASTTTLLLLCNSLQGINFYD